MSSLPSNSYANGNAANAASADPPPPGCSVRNESDGGLSIEVSTTSRENRVWVTGAAALCMLVPGVILAGVLGYCYAQWVGPLPPWIPPISMSMSVATALAVMAVPFLGIGLWLTLVTITAWFGGMRLRVDKSRITISTGFGKTCRRVRYIETARIISLGIAASRYERDEGVASPEIVINADRRVAFGVLLTNEQRHWLLRTLRDHLPISIARSEAKETTA